MLRLTFLLSFTISALASTDIVGCGGFIKSHVPIDLSLVDIRLYTKQETLKDSSDCAPTNGYYFIPLSDKGEYKLRVEPPAGWFFEPREVIINFDGVNDLCSKSADINFNFKGFTVNGKVTTRGSKNGPEGVKISLKSEKGTEIGSTVTSKGGAFNFSPILPGSYTILPQHASLKFTSSAAKVNFSVDKLAVPEGSLVVAGFDITGSVVSNGEPVKGVSIFIAGTDGSKNGLPVDCKTDVVVGAGATAAAGALCHVYTDSSGSFRFSSVPCGRYQLRPYYETFQIAPAVMDVVVESSHISLSEPFLVKGFSVSGRVLRSARGQGLPGAVIYVDKVAAATSDANGRFQLDRMEAGFYDLSAKSDDYQFGNVRVKIWPTSAEVEPLVPSGVRVCGRVTPAPGGAPPRLHIRPGDPAAPALVLPVQQQNGRFCEFLQPASYSISVLLSESDSSLRYLPISREIVVSDAPITDLDFSQLRAVVQGRIKRLPSPGGDSTVVVTLRSQDQVVAAAELTPQTDQFVFNDVAPGAYVISVSSQRFCFKENAHAVAVNSAKVQTPDFIQIGHVIRVRSSHQTDIKIKSLKKELIRTESLSKGENVLCLGSSGKFIFAPSGCHGYEKEEMTWDVGTDSDVDLVAISHDVSGVVTTTDPTPVILHVRSGTQHIAKLGPLSGSKTGEGHRYEFVYRVREGQHVQLVPEAAATVFGPETAELRGGYDCVGDAVHFTGERGLLVSGGISPPLQGVTVSLTIPATSFQTSVVTKADGKFTFGPFKKNSQFELSAEKESYVLSGPDAKHMFKAHKLAQVQVTVADTNGSPLSGVLLSLTGGEKYRKNSITEDSGERTFHSLSPGEYFLRPMMKEYKFEPASIIIQLQEGETKSITIKGRRVAFSVFGSVTSLNGEAEEGVPVEVVGRGGCAGMQEEGVSDGAGTFRVRGLLPDCEYTLQMKADTRSTVHRVVPPTKNVSTRDGDVYDIRLLALHHVAHTDASVHVTAAVPEHLKTLTVKLYRDDRPDSPVHVVKLDTLAGGVKNWGDAASQERFLRGGLLVSLPVLNKDGTAYNVTCETSLNAAGHTFSAPTASFQANRPFIALDIHFEARLRSVEQESPRHFVAGLFLGLLGLIYWQLRQGWSIVGLVASWWSSRQEANSSSSDRKKLRARKT